MSEEIPTEEEQQRNAEEREALLAAFTEVLEGPPVAEWRKKFACPENHATVGAVLRPADALLKAHGVPSPASICVLRIDGSEAIVVPFRIEGRVGAGEVLIPPDLSPFGLSLTGAMVLEMDCALRFPVEALQAFKGIARCPAVSDVPAMSALAPPSTKRAVYAAWLRLIAALPQAN